ncbi:MAG TPA: hypothetical protein VNB94_13175 [Mycobacteriales bacterium]|nr:hypothetical protein [Mycobacteriales bacterium]
MPDLVDDLFDAVVADVAAHTRPPGARSAIARARRRAAGTAAAAIAAVALVAVSASSLVRGPSPESTLTPAPSAVDVGEQAVWYDDLGLHRGDAVQQPAVPLSAGSEGRGALLTLVRTGALYFDAAHDEVWFHPWGGDPRVVGRNATHGPVGDHDGDLAAWFEGSRLVVLDTAAGRELARVDPPAAARGTSGEHLDSANGILQVSAAAVVWLTGDSARRFDVRTKFITELPATAAPAGWTDGISGNLTDVHDGTGLWSWGLADGGAGLSIRRDGDETELTAFEPTTGRLSPDGRFLLGVTRDPHAPAFVDVASGEIFRGPEPTPGGHSWVAWSHGDTALILLTADIRQQAGTLYACRADLRRCDALRTAGPVVLPS